MEKIIFNTQTDIILLLTNITTSTGATNVQIAAFVGSESNQQLSQSKHFHIVIMCSLLYKIQKHFQNVMLVGMASETSKNYTYKCVDRSRHNGIKGAKAKCAH